MTLLYFETNPVNLINILTIIILMCVMYFSCRKFGYGINVVIYCLISTLFTSLFDKIMSAIVPWMSLSSPITFWSFIINFILGAIVVKILMKISDYTEDSKLFVLLGSITQFIIELIIYFLFNLIF